MNTPGITVLDGGMGRELLRIGAPFRQPEWSALALMEGPDWVVTAHRNFIDAGADVVTTNSYALVPFHLGDSLWSERAAELIELSGRLARQSADSTTSRQVRVAGSLPPPFGSYRPDLFDAEGAPRLLDPLVGGLADHVDVWLAETMSSVAEVEAVRAALHRSRASQPLWVSYTLDDGSDSRLRSGEPVADAARAAVALGAAAVLFNCCAAEAITTAIETASATVGGDVAIGGYANRFATAHAAEGEANERISAMRDDLDPASYREIVSEWIDRGATIVGGCCGMEPAHIAELVALVR